MKQDNDVDDVAIINKQLIQSPRIPAQFTLHVYKPFSEYLKLKYGEDEEVINHHRQEELDYVFSIGIKKTKNELDHPILFKEKKPRKDELYRLGKIASDLKLFSGYPKIKSMNITKTINRVMNSKDSRTKTKYHQWVQQYIGKPKEFGLTDVSEFVNRIPDEYLDTTTSTSSSEEEPK